jgi:hypothetical protein
MLDLLKQLLKGTRRIAWAILVGYMIAWHNVYKEETKMPQDIVISIEEDKPATDPITKL